VDQQEATTRLYAAIERNAPADSYRRQAQPLISPHYVRERLERLRAILRAIRADLAGGYVQTLEDRVRDDLSADLLETAESIASCAPPAIVLAVSVLEEHVRKLCAARDLDTITNGRHRSFEDMTADLQRHEDGVGSTERRTLQAWYAQRTAAAHGRFDEVIESEAPSIVRGVRDFIARHPH
jgi:hypothetical protein